MHGIVCVTQQAALRPAIIAGVIHEPFHMGRMLSETIGPEVCLQHLMNSPENFYGIQITKLKTPT